MNEGFTMSMFWAGAMMAFVPLIFFGVLVGVWWYRRKQSRKLVDPTASPPSRVP